MHDRWSLECDHRRDVPDPIHSHSFLSRPTYSCPGSPFPLSFVLLRPVPLIPVPVAHSHLQCHHRRDSTQNMQPLTTSTSASSSGSNRTIRMISDGPLSLSGEFYFSLRCGPRLRRCAAQQRASIPHWVSVCTVWFGFGFPFGPSDWFGFGFAPLFAWVLNRLGGPVP